jgi:hypothetical protein
LDGAYNLGKFGVVGLDFMGMDYGRILWAPVGHIMIRFKYDVGTFQPSAYFIGMTNSQKVSNRFSYGVRLKYVYQDLGTALIGTAGTDVDDSSLVIESKAYHHGELAMDIGATYDFLSHGIRFGAVMRNFSREIKYEIYKFPMPFAVGFSMVLRPLTFINTDSRQHDLEIVLKPNIPAILRKTKVRSRIYLSPDVDSENRLYG